MELINHRRTLTDIPLLILFGVFLCAWFSTGIYAFLVVESPRFKMDETPMISRKIYKMIPSYFVDSSNIILLACCTILCGILSYLEFLTCCWVSNLASKFFLVFIIFSIMNISLISLRFIDDSLFEGIKALVIYVCGYIVIFTLIHTEWFHLPQKVLKETCKIIMQSKALVLFVLVWNMMTVLISIFGAFMLAYINGIPGLSPTSERVLQTISFFGWLWISGFNLMLGQAVVFGTFASYFWNHQCDKIIVLRCIQFISRYHLGTIAYSSSIFGIIQNIRIALSYVIKRCRQNSYGCSFLWFTLYNIFEPIVLQWMYICGPMIGIIRGKGYYESTKESFGFLARHPRRCLVVAMVANCVLLTIALCNMALVITCITLFFLIKTEQISREYIDDMSYLILFLCSQLFVFPLLWILHAGQQAVLICFLEDLELHNGSAANPYVMSNDLELALAHDGPPQWYRKCLSAMKSAMSAFASLILRIKNSF